MKRLIFIVLFLLVSMAGCAGMQPVPESEKIVEGIFDVPGFSKNQIFSATKIWIAENFRSAKAVIEYENEKDGTLIGNGIMPYPCQGLDCVVKHDHKVPFTMRVDMKDDKFKLTFSNLRITWPPSFTSTGSYPSGNISVSTQGDMNAIKPKLLEFGPELVSAIQKNEKSKDW